MPRKLRASTNPSGPGHHWVKARFIDPAPRGVVITDEHGNQRVTLHGHWSENRYLIDNDPEYVGRLMAATEDDPDQQAAWIDGSWDVSAGTFFGASWNRKLHVLTPFTVPQTWRIDRAFDWGESKPFSVGWWAECDGSPVIHADGTQRTYPRGTLIRVAEWYGCVANRPNVGTGLTSAEIANGIKQREREWWPDRRISAGPADSSIFDVTDGHCIGDEFAKNRVTWLPANKGPGSRKNGWSLMRDRFKAARPLNKGKPMEKPGLFVFDTCRDFIRTIPMMPRDDVKTDDVDTDSEDHIGDETRYRCLAIRHTSSVGTLRI